jgi:hypothetical protein
MFELLSSLIIAASLGYLAQTTGLCMVRGMKEWMNGRPSFMAAILFSGVFAWVAGMLSGPLGFDLPYQRIAVDWWFLLGGFLFGIGTAFNQGCGVSTLSKLSRGELEMVATISGWLLGWYILDLWGPSVQINLVETPGLGVFGILAGTSVVLFFWLLRSDPARRKLWFAMMGIGLLAGFLFLYERGWTPSGLLHDLSAAARGVDSSPWPSASRYLIILSLLGGMISVAMRTKSFKLRVPKAKVVLIHLLAGSLMGVGAALAKGGNDSQLLLTLPVFSPAGLAAVASMLLGLYLGLRVRKIS